MISSLIKRSGARHFSGRHILALAAVAGASALLGAGCGGGSSGGSSTSTPSATATPSPTATVRPTANSLVVQLRDGAGASVDGIVTLGAQRRATTGGSATLTNVTLGSQTVSVEVNGVTYSQTVVATSGVTTVQITVAPMLTPTPQGTIPAPPTL